MTQSQKIKAIIASSYILFLLGHLDNKDKIKGSVIILRQRIFANVSKEDRSLAQLADTAWSRVAKSMEVGNLYSIDVAVESLFFKFEDELSLYLGADIGILISRATMKLPNDKRGIRGSYDLVDKLKESVDKIVFDKIKDEK